MDRSRGPAQAEAAERAAGQKQQQHTAYREAEGSQKLLEGWRPPSMAAIAL